MKDVKATTQTELLFQYGSNMRSNHLNSPERLDGAARKVGPASLEGWGIRFDLFSTTNTSGVTDIVQSPDETVFGALYEVPRELIIAPKGRRSRMDEIEGAKEDGTGNYMRSLVYVLRRDRHIQAYTYIGTQIGRDRFSRLAAQVRRVSRGYFEHLRSGALEFDLPKSYLNYLRRQAGVLKD